MKDDLIEFYRWRHSNVQLSPLFEEKDTPLASFYIRPEISQVKSLSDMFKTGCKTYREIYLTADAGFGKTTFSKYLVNSWCQAHRPIEIDRTNFEMDDIDCMHEFEFIFLVLLRDSSDLCSVDDFIFELIVSNLAHSKQFDINFLEEILNREKCLVILDGLDEWTHPRKPCYRTTRLIPHRNTRETCTVLTTTRPWKLGALNLSSNELGKQVDLSKLNIVSAVTLILRTLQKLKSLDDEDLETEALNFIEEYNTDLALVPLILMYMICLWFDGVKIGSSNFALYAIIVELLLSRTTAKHGELKSSLESSPRDIEECFIGLHHCTKYFTLLMALGKLAYQTLFNENRENTLVFFRSVTEIYCKEDDIKLSLLSGILTESTSKTLTKRISKVSFSHKTVQEFFAAIYISSQRDGQKTILKKCETVESIFDMSTVCQFISRLNATMMCEISEGFMSVIYKDEETCEYRTGTGF